MPTTRTTRSTPATAPAPVAPPSAPAAPLSADPGLSAYELQRLENIRANEAVLASLNLTSFKAELGVPTTSGRPSQRGVVSSSRKRSASPSVPTRTSNRTKNIQPEYNGMHIEHTDGRVEIEGADGQILQVRPGCGERKEMRPEDLRAALDHREPIPFHRVNNDDESDVEEDIADIWGSDDYN